MANPEHLEILMQGVDVWNAWRDAYPTLNPNLRGGSLGRHANLAGANLSKVDLRYTHLVRVSFIESNLKGAKLSYADLTRAKLTRANLCEARLIGTNLSHANLSGARLNVAELQRTYLAGANLSGVSCMRANLSGATFIGGNLQDANLSFSNLAGANLTGADLTRTNFSEASLDRTVFGDNDFRQAIGLEDVNHLGPSEISISTIYKSDGKIPEVFLRGCGAPNEFITYLRSLVGSGQPIQFYKCFISFTEADDAFSERLYNDLQAKGVRCWRWKEDAKWGKTLMYSIDEAVRLYDKLIIICSKQSLNSPAVIREIERALQKEDDLTRQGKEGEVLFPIRLDDYIFTGWNHHRKADVIAKNIGDFRRWKDHDSYQKGFDRLLRDLKADTTPASI